MKTVSSFSAIALSLILSAFTLTAGTPHSDHAKTGGKTMKRICLELKGTASLNGVKVKDFTIKLYKGDKVIQKISEAKKQVFTFLLEEDAEYTLCFSMEGFADRMIRINTSLPDEVELKPIFRYIFDMEFIKDDDQVTSSVLDFPAGLICFDEKTGKFEYSRKYASSIKKLKKNEMASR